MAYMEFKPVVKKVNLKPDGKKEIVLEINDSALDGKLDALAKMISCKVDCSFESQVVNYNILLNAQTNKPLTTYQVDEKGVVSEVKPAFEQLEADLDLPKEKVETKEEKQEASVEVVDEFIKSGLAPNYDDIPYDMPSLIKRKYEGETYMKLASELNLSSGRIVEIIDDYRARVAPLAVKWWEWKKEKGAMIEEQPEKAEKQEEPKEQAETDAENKEDDVDDQASGAA
jgi:hypothetical protein